MARVPEIVINGQTIKPPKPKMALWREIIKLKDISTEINTEFLDSVATIIVKAFNSPLVTIETIEEALDLDEYMTLFKDVTEWIEGIATQRVERIPNVETPKG